MLGVAGTMVGYVGRVLCLVAFIEQCHVVRSNGIEMWQSQKEEEKENAFVRKEMHSHQLAMRDAKRGIAMLNATL